MVIHGLKIFFGIPILMTPFAQGFSITTWIIGLAGAWLILSGVLGLLSRFAPKEISEKSPDQQDRP